MLVESAATRNLVGPGRGQREASPRRAGGVRRRSPARAPPSRPRAARASASARLPCSSWPAGIGAGELARRRDHPYPAVADVEEASAVDAERAHAGQRLQARRGAGRERRCPERVRRSRSTETHTSVTRFMSAAVRSSPLCRLLWAPWIATLPNTATAPVAAIASERVRVAGVRSSITASLVAAERSGR